MTEGGQDAPRFVADAMLGKLARWLRVAGYDTVFDTSLHDPELVELARKEKRVLLTRDRHLILHLRPERGVLLKATDTLGQVREVAETCQLASPPGLFSRCLVCNSRLREATASEVEALVPERARGLGGPFMRCTGCGRAYWHGTHVRRMRETLVGVCPGWFD